MMMDNMEYYEVQVPASDGKLLSQLKNETVLRSLEFDEDNQHYFCKGYALKDHAISGYLVKYKAN
jgi:GTP-binding protein HflX